MSEGEWAPALRRHFNAGLDAALVVLQHRISHYEAVRHELRPHDAMGVIETELRQIAETLQKRRRAG